MMSERVETGFPGLPPAIGPTTDLHEHGWVQPVDALLARGRDVDDPRLPQHAEVAGHGRLADGEEIDQFVDAALAFGEDFDDVDASVIGQRRECGHGANISRCRYVCNRPPE